MKKIFTFELGIKNKFTNLLEVAIYESDGNP